MPDTVTIAPLEHASWTASIVGSWIDNEWGRLPIHDYFGSTALGKHSPTTFPRTFVAIFSGIPIGTVSLLENDLETSMDLNPWLGCLYVLPQQRKRGIGTRLVSVAEHFAFSVLKCPRLYLFTDKEQALYARLSWRFFESVEYRGDRVAIMDKLNPNL